MAEKAIPQLTIHLGGTLVNTAPEPTAHAPRFIIQLNGVICSLVPIPECSDKNLSSTSSDDNDLKSKEINSNGDGNGNEDDNDDNLLNEVNRYCKKGRNNEQDAEDGLDWMFDADEVTSKDPSYVFCPAPHQKQLLPLFTKHYCQHPLFAERHGKWGKEKIHQNAVYEMYNFCYTQGLQEVWGYMWACWYAPKMWCLWASSTSPYISHLHTTMNVENFWWQLKHNYLHYVARP
jgi:hypothetical protein